MVLKIHEPQVEMGGGQVIRVSNEDRSTAWVTFHIDAAIREAATVDFPQGRLRTAFPIPGANPIFMRHAPPSRGERPGGVSEAVQPPQPNKPVRP
jgi:hypothetical protein